MDGITNVAASADVDPGGWPGQEIAAKRGNSYSSTLTGKNTGNFLIRRGNVDERVALKRNVLLASRREVRFLFGEK